MRWGAATRCRGSRVRAGSSARSCTAQHWPQATRQGRRAAHHETDGGDSKQGGERLLALGSIQEEDACRQGNEGRWNESTVVRQVDMAALRVQ